MHVQGKEKTKPGSVLYWPVDTTAIDTVSPAAVPQNQDRCVLETKESRRNGEKKKKTDREERQPKENRTEEEERKWQNRIKEMVYVFARENEGMNQMTMKEKSGPQRNVCGSVGVCLCACVGEKWYSKKNMLYVCVDVCGEIAWILHTTQTESACVCERGGQGKTRNIPNGRQMLWLLKMQTTRSAC